MLPMQLLLAGALFLLGALTDTLQFAPALYTVEQTVSCVLLNIPFVPFAIDNVQSFLGQEQRATHQLRLTCNLLINSQTTNDLLRSLASISSEFKDAKFYDSQSAIDVSKGPSIDLTPSLSWGAMSPATPAQVPVTPIPAPIPAPTIPVIQQQEPISNQTGVIREVEFYHISFFITQRDCIVAAITATVVTLLHALAYLISAWIMQDNDTEEYDEDFVPEAAIMLVPWVDCLLDKYGYDSSVVEDEALTIIDNVEPSILVDSEHPSTYEEPVEQDNGVLDIEHPLDTGDSGLHDLNQDITATVPYALDQASPANNATTTDEDNGASLSQPIHDSECAPETADLPVMQTQEATTQVVDVPSENNTQPTEESIHVEFKETNHIETDIVQPKVEQDVISAAQSETAVPDLITEQLQTSGLPDIEAVPDQPVEIHVVKDLSMYDDSTKKTLDIDVHQTESPVMATPKPTDHIDILKPEVSEFSEFSGGLNDSIHAPKAIKQAKALQGLVSNGTSVSSVRMNASAAPFIPNFTKTFVSESPKQESVPSRKHSQDLELSPPRKLESYSEPTFVSKGGLGDSMWAPKSGLTASHGIRTSKTVETSGLADSIWAPKIAETPGLADSIWAPKTVKADTRQRRNTIGDTARRPTVHEDVSTETAPTSDSESDEMEWQQASNAHYGNSKENINVPSGNADASMGQDSGSDTTAVEYNGDCETVSLVEVHDTIQSDQTSIIKDIAEGVSPTQMERKQELDKEEEEEHEREQEQGPEIESPIASPTTSPRVLAMDRELEARNRNYGGSGWSGNNNRGGRGRGQARGQARGQDQNRSQRQGGGSSRGRGRRGGNYSNNGQQGGNSFSNNGQRGGYSSSNNEQSSQEKAQSEWNNFRTYPRQVRGGA